MTVVINGTTGITTPTESVATTIGVGGATPSASGSGITFPATQSASTDPSTLDDYEEGTWLPTVIGSSTAGAATYSIRSGSYVKIGQMVYVGIRVAWSAHTGTGNLQINNLPFTAAPSIYGILNVAFNDGLTIPAGSILNIQINPSTTSLTFNSLATGGSTAGLAMDTSTTDINFAGWYQASA